MKNIALLGSTGSIGRQALEVINSLGSDFKVVALTAGRNDLDLAAQVKRIKPEFAALADPEAADRLAAAVSDLNIAVESGDEGQLKAATWPGVDIVVMAQVGFSGFQPLVAALRAGKTIALANKESLVIGGDLLERLGLLDR
ncbi:MAG: 1-deoxy-D-xylulose-5-phosphate reductoisomerase, partial [Dethiobacteria bacterium]